MKKIIKWFLKEINTKTVSTGTGPGSNSKCEDCQNKPRCVR